MYKYVQKSGEIKIKAPIKEMPKHEVLEHTSELIHTRYTYSNGWIYESKLYADRIEMWSNAELILGDDGQYHPKLSE